MLLLIVAAALVAVGPESGPPKGAKLPKLKVVVAQEALREAEDLAEKRKDKPTIFVFIPKENWERPTARFLRAVDEQLEHVHQGKLVVVWIAENSVEENAEYLRKVSNSLMTSRTTWTVFHGEAGELGDWEINPDTNATVVVASEGKVLKSVGFRQVNEGDAKDFIKLLTGK